MTRADWAWAISLTVIILVSLALIGISVAHATDVPWMCARGWTAC